MDIKISSVSTEILKKALEQARKGRMHILDIMGKTISAPASEISEYAPKVVSVKVDQDKIGAIIGPGGKNIKSMSEKYEVQINVEEDGIVTVYGKNGKAAYEARDAILSMIENPEVGKIYDGTVKRIMDFGAFIEIIPGKEGLCHISRMAKERVEQVTDIVHEGDKVKVKLMEIDHLGRLNLAMVSALDENGEIPAGSARPADSRDPNRDRSAPRDSRRFGDSRRDSYRSR
jgi:polyribonucleotide nucleotidyltransferase